MHVKEVLNCKRDVMLVTVENDEGKSSRILVGSGRPVYGARLDIGARLRHPDRPEDFTEPEFAWADASLEARKEVMEVFQTWAAKRIAEYVQSDCNSAKDIKWLGVGVGHVCVFYTDVDGGEIEATATLSVHSYDQSDADAPCVDYSEVLAQLKKALLK